MIATFSPNQIVSLKYQKKCLYCEVIGIVETRSIGWFRPVMLVDIPKDNDDFDLDNQEVIYDLRFSSDLLWQVNVFSPVLDTEYITFFSKLEQPHWNEKKSKLAKQKLTYFLEEICRKY